MDIKDIIKWSLQHWWWYAISIAVCAVFGIIYYQKTAPKFKVEATLMLRQNENGSQEEMLRMMGYGNNKMASDEVEVLKSRDLIGRVIDSLDICTVYYKKVDGIWKEQYPNHDAYVWVPQTLNKPLNISINIRKNGYKVKIKYDKTTESYRVPTLSEPVSTFIGDIALVLPDSIKEGKYRITMMPRILMVDYYVNNLSVDRISRESSIISVQMKTICPAKSIALINSMLDFYNLESAYDKNRLATQTDEFLTSRLDLITSELNSAESELENYKRRNQIADLAGSATSYRNTSESYKEQVIELERQLNILDTAMAALTKYFGSYMLVSGNMGLTDRDLCSAINEYNTLVKRRNLLLQTATGQNTMVQMLNQQLDERIKDIEMSTDQLRQTLSQRKLFLQDQQSRYDERLASIPETERRYMVMSRDKSTKEKQYLYLIQKREENAMMLASDAVPARIIDRAQMDPNPLSPKISKIGLTVLLLGFLFPLCFYFIGFIRKEYL